MSQIALKCFSEFCYLELGDVDSPPPLEDVSEAVAQSKGPDPLTVD